MLNKPDSKHKLEIFKDLSCENCVFYSQEKYEQASKGLGFSLPDGTGSSGVMLLGEALGSVEAEKGIPFQGQAGGQLNKVLYQLKRQREEFVIWNAVACKPPGNVLGKHENEVVNHCRQYFDRVVRIYDPKVIVPMGNVPLKAVLGVSGIDDFRGYVFRELIAGKFRWVVPTYHPAFILRGNQNLHYLMLNDIQKALKIAESGWEKYVGFYIQHPDPAKIREFISDAAEFASQTPEAWLAADIETEFSSRVEEDQRRSVAEAEIIRISFAFKPGYAITIPWQNLELIQEIFTLPFQNTIWWNADFDVPRIEAQGIKIHPEPMDAMWMWHFYHSALPKGLGKVASAMTTMDEWKSKANVLPQYYSCADADATISIALKLKEELKRERRWEAYLEHVHRLLPKLKVMGESGILVDLEKKEEFRKTLVARLEELKKSLAEYIPEFLRPVKLYKQKIFNITCPQCRGSGKAFDVQKLRKAKVPVDRAARELENIEEFFIDEPCKKCRGKGTARVRVSADDFPGDADLGDFVVRDFGVTKAFCLFDEFNPLSSKQMLEYLKAKGYRIPKNYKTGQPTTDEDALKVLLKSHPNDPVFPIAMEIRKINKLISQYCDGYKVSPDGRLRTRFTLKPSTGRLASEQIIRNMEGGNVQNIRKRPDQFISAETLKDFRKMFIPSPGHVLLARDYKGIEAVLTGWYAGDEDYIKAARLGIHAILASQLELMGVPILDVSRDRQGWIETWVKRIKRDFRKQYDICKVIVHGSNYMASPRKLYMTYPETLSSEALAKRIQDIYFKTLAKKVKQWQLDTIARAHRDFYLENVFKYRHYFWDVLEKGGTFSQQAKDALAFLPQSTAAGIIKKAILNLDEELFSFLRWQIHDELLFEVPENRLEEINERIKQVMEAPIEEMDGFYVETEGSWGYNWGEMNDGI